MTDFYKAGKYWPETNEIVNTFDGGSMQVIAINPEDSYDESPSHAKEEFVYEGIYDGNYIFPVTSDDHAEFIFEEGNGDSSSATSSLMGDHPYDGAHVFTDELELLLTNVDGDSDPDVITIPSTMAARRQCRRVYRKSMSLPMSPIGGARERLDSLNLGEFLLGSPLKMGGMIDSVIDVDPVDHYEDLSLRSDFNLINFLGQDGSPVKMRKAEPVTVPVVVQPEVVETPPPVVVEAKKPALSKGKCLDLLRATHERQENLVKRCVAIENQKRTVTKNLFKSVSVPAKSEGVLPTRGRPPTKVPRRSNNHNVDPNWSPTRDMETPKKSAKTVAVKREKANSTTNSQSASSSANKANLVSGTSNLSEIKKRFLANIPIIPKTSHSSGVTKTPLKVLRTDIPIVPIADHDYCSPVKRSQPIGRTIKSRTKTAILIDDIPKIKKDKGSPKKNPPPLVLARTQPNVEPRALAEPHKVQDPATIIVAEKRKTINLEDYKRMRSAETSSSSSTVKVAVLPQRKNPEAVTPVKVAPIAEKPLVPAPKEYVDPISEAKNKALRLQEKRKAAKLRQGEIRLPTPPLVPILPLAIMAGLTTEGDADLMGGGPKKGLSLDDKSLHFDEIMIVSVGCNTEVTILPSYESIVGNISQSSSYLLSNLSSRAKNPITSNSLLFSIQDVVIKKSVPQNFVIQKSPNSAISVCGQYSPGKPEGASVGVPNDHTGYHHGEDKVIMHLRKDRIRAKTSTFGCQTDITPEFPQLKLLASKNRRHCRRRSTSASSTGSSSSNSDSDSRSESSRSSDYSVEESQDEFGRCAKRRRLYSNNKSWSRSRSRSQSSYTRSRRSKSPGYKGRSRERSPPRYNRTRSRSPRRHSLRESRSRSRSRSPSRRPFTRTNNNKNNNRWMNRSPVEERRIVYVGRLEKDLTKEGLRKKFNDYGTIKLVTLHEKSNGTRYGFVTFEEATDAFRAIESAKEDPVINMYDVSFGGRRAFCGSSYADLDNVETEEDIYGMAPVASSNAAERDGEESFESLLQSFKKKVLAVGP